MVFNAPLTSRGGVPAMAACPVGGVSEATSFRVTVTFVGERFLSRKLDAFRLSPKPTPLVLDNTTSNGAKYWLNTVPARIQ